MDEPTKRAWSRPELILLGRGGAEEAVLDTCKYSATPGSSGAVANECMTACDVSCNGIVMS